MTIAVGIFWQLKTIEDNHEITSVVVPSSVKGNVRSGLLAFDLTRMCPVAAKLSALPFCEESAPPCPPRPATKTASGRSAVYSTTTTTVYHRQPYHHHCHCSRTYAAHRPSHATHRSACTSSPGKPNQTNARGPTDLSRLRLPLLRLALPCLALTCNTATDSYSSAR